MAIIYIAFIECVLTPKSSWYTVYGFPQLENPRTDGLYKAKNKDAEVRLVELKKIGDISVFD